LHKHLPKRQQDVSRVHNSKGKWVAYFSTPRPKAFEERDSPREKETDQSPERP
jgi:hypothetical protein